MGATSVAGRNAVVVLEVVEEEPDSITKTCTVSGVPAPREAARRIPYRSRRAGTAK